MNEEVSELAEEVAEVSSEIIMDFPYLNFLVFWDLNVIKLSTFEHYKALSTDIDR